MAVGAAFFWIAFTFARHLHFQTQAWDMGIFDQLFWNTIHGRFMEGTLEELPNHFGVHFSPSLLLLTPFYAIFQSPYTLLLLQVLALTAGAFPIFEIAKRKLPEPFPLLLAAGYLLSPSLHWITTYDFHEIAFFVPSFLFAWNALESGKLNAAAVFFSLAAGTKEDAILAVLFAGLAIMAMNRGDKRLRKFGALLAILSLIYFTAVTKIFMPSFGGGLLRLDRYSHLGNSGIEIVRNILTDPLLIFKTVLTAEKLSYLFWLLIPTAGTALFYLPSTALLIPGLAENLLTNFPAQFSGTYQYDAILLPGIFIASIYGISYFLNRQPEKKNLLSNILILTVVGSYLLRSPVNPVFFPLDIFRSGPETSIYSELVSRVPAGASVSASTNLVPHLSRRKEIYMIGTEFGRPVDFIVIDAGNLSGFADEEMFQAYGDSYMNSGNYVFEEIAGRYFILKRKSLY